MHDDPRTPSDASFHQPPTPGNNAPGAGVPGDSPADKPGDTPRRQVPAPLQNWRVLDPAPDASAGASQPTLVDAEPVIEIDGEASVVDAPAADGTAVGATIADRPDRLIGLGLDQRRYAVEPGEAVTIQVELLNNGPSPALFEVNIEGWIDEAWIPDLPVRLHLPPGHQRTIQVTLALPRSSAARAGEYAFAVTAQTARYAGHVARVGAVLAVARHTAFQLGSPQPRRVQTSWFRRSALVHVPLYNLSNHTVRFSLRAFAPSRTASHSQAAHFTFYPPVAAGALADSAGDEDLGGVGRPGEGLFQAEPGASVLLPVRIEPTDRPWIGLSPQVTGYRMVARLLNEFDEPEQRRSVEGQIGLSPLIGPWQMGIAALLALAAVVGVGLTGLALLLALRSPGQAPAAASATAATPVPPAVFVIQLEQPAPTRAAGEAGTVAAGLPVEQPLAQPMQPEGGDDSALAAPVGAAAPIVRADQVTAPGEPTRANQMPLQPLAAEENAAAAAIATPTAVVIGAPASDQATSVQPAPRSSAPSGMTYGEMFREIGMRYDWDWRLLAAQAYIESGFDSLALSNDGDMGLMQIRPPTWQEWAPQVNATDPFDSYSNVLVAARYLDYLRTLLSERGYPQQEWTLVAYNWGPDEVLNYLAAGGTWETLTPTLRSYAEDIKQIAQTIPDQ